MYDYAAIIVNPVYTFFDDEIRRSTSYEISFWCLFIFLGVLIWALCVTRFRVKDDTPDDNQLNFRKNLEKIQINRELYLILNEQLITGCQCLLRSLHLFIFIYSLEVMLRLCIVNSNSLQCCFSTLISTRTRLILFLNYSKTPSMSRYIS